MFTHVFQRFFNKPNSRSTFLDAYRGCAVLLMIVFHLCWDLRAFDYLEYSLKSPFWVSFRAIIMTLFITAIGWSAYLSYRTSIRWNAFLTRHIKLLLCATAISLATYLAFPDHWIFFGILHFILLASIIITPVSQRPWLSVGIGVTLLSIYFFNDDINAFSFHRYLTHTFHLPTYTLDFVHPLPWFAVVFFGPLLGHLGLHNIRLPENRVSTLFALAGRYALVIYLCHQLVLYSLVTLLDTIIKQLA
ncbi:DUF1624 domain-containing protein [Marinomonas agarivorans]|nr:DUF1624 domain-containing protein [Marinomonas agarivorans]